MEADLSRVDWWRPLRVSRQVPIQVHAHQARADKTQIPEVHLAAAIRHYQVLPSFGEAYSFDRRFCGDFKARQNPRGFSFEQFDISVAMAKRD